MRGNFSACPFLIEAPHAEQDAFETDWNCKTGRE